MKQDRIGSEGTANWVIRKYREGDERQINDLFNLVFGESRTLKEWRNKFVENPYMTAQSLSSLITVAESEGNIVGIYANLPIIFKMKNSLLRVAQPVDNMVHPRFQGSAKVIRDLFAIQYERAEEDGIYFGFGVPNERYYPIGKRFLGYKDVGMLCTLFKRLNWRLAIRGRLTSFLHFAINPVKRLSARIVRASLAFSGWEKRVRLVNVERFDERVDNLWERAKGRYGVMAVRDCRYLNWRYVEKPDDPYYYLLAEADGEVLGYIILKLKKSLESNVGFIVDMLSVEERSDKVLIKAALRHFLNEEVDYVLCRALREGLLYKSLLNLGFIEREEFKPAPVVYKLFREVDEYFLKKPGNWYLTYGDQIDVAF